MHPLHIQITLHEFGRNEHSILASQCSTRPGRRASSAFFSLEAGPLSSGQDILGDAEQLAWDGVETKKDVDIDPHPAHLPGLSLTHSLTTEPTKTPSPAPQR